jgi:hypothetical protein
MTGPVLQRFDTRAAFQEQLRAVLARAQATLELFDPDFSLLLLDTSDVDALLRGFLRQGGRMRLAMHDAAWLEREAPRFLRLLRDYSDRIECRVTPRSLRELTDSFCITDERHIVRRFHSDHMRGAAAFDCPQELEVPRERFAAIWSESLAGVHVSTTGL